MALASRDGVIVIIVCKYRICINDLNFYVGYSIVFAMSQISISSAKKTNYQRVLSHLEHVKAHEIEGNICRRLTEILPIPHTWYHRSKVICVKKSQI